MLSLITGYFKEMAGFLVFSGIISAAAPDRFKKYVLLSAGFVLIIIALKPLSALQNRDYGDEAVAAFAWTDGGGINDVPELPAVRQALTRQIESQYVLTLSERLSEKINADSPDFTYVSATFDVDTNADGDSFGAINGVTVRVVPKGQISAETPRPFIYIERIEVTIEDDFNKGYEQGDKGYKEGDEPPEITRLKNLISDFYNVSKPHINIVVGAD